MHTATIHVFSKPDALGRQAFRVRTDELTEDCYADLTAFLDRVAGPATTVHVIDTTDEN